MSGPDDLRTLIGKPLRAMPRGSKATRTFPARRGAGKPLIETTP